MLIHVQTGVFKTQMDWIPLSTGSVRPTQGRTLAVAQVSGGSQSFNSVNSLRILGRWMRMFTIPNQASPSPYIAVFAHGVLTALQSSIPMAYKHFTDAVDPSDKEAYVAAEGGSRLMPSGNRDRVVDCMEEFVKYTIIMRPHFEAFGDRYSERTERQAKREREEKDLALSHDGAKMDANGVVNGVSLKQI
jgi:arsenic resistance protein ArsH